MEYDKKNKFIFLEIVLKDIKTFWDVEIFDLVYPPEKKEICVYLAAPKISTCVGTKIIKIPSYEWYIDNIENR